MVYFTCMPKLPDPTLELGPQMPENQQPIPIKASASDIKKTFGNFSSMAAAIILGLVGFLLQK